MSAIELVFFVLMILFLLSGVALAMGRFMWRLVTRAMPDLGANGTTEGSSGSGAESAMRPWHFSE